MATDTADHAETNILLRRGDTARRVDTGRNSPAFWHAKPIICIASAGAAHVRILPESPESH